MECSECHGMSLNGYLWNAAPEEQRWLCPACAANGAEGDFPSSVAQDECETCSGADDRVPCGPYKYSDEIS